MDGMAGGQMVSGGKRITLLPADRPAPPPAAPLPPPTRRPVVLRVARTNSLLAERAIRQAKATPHHATAPLPWVAKVMAGFNMRTVRTCLACAKQLRRRGAGCPRESLASASAQMAFMPIYGMPLLMLPREGGRGQRADQFWWPVRRRDHAGSWAYWLTGSRSRRPSASCWSACCSPS